jgi:hypothetical protein
VQPHSQKVQVFESIDSRTKIFFLVKKQTWKDVGGFNNLKMSIFTNQSAVYIYVGGNFTVIDSMLIS